MRNNFQIDRIKADLAKARQRIYELENPAPIELTDSTYRDAGAHAIGAIAASSAAQLIARRNDVVRLEDEYLGAMIGSGRWKAGDIIRKMEGA